MDMHQFRRERLDALIKEKFGGKRSAFGAKVNMSDVRVGQLLSHTFREGRNFGENIARKLEAQLNLPPMYFDQGAADVGLKGWVPPTGTIAPAEQPALDPIEQMLLKRYREAGPATQDAIVKIFQALPLADRDSIGILAHQFSRAIVEQMGLQLIPLTPTDTASLSEEEGFLLSQFAGMSPANRRLVLLGAGCEPLPDDEVPTAGGRPRCALRLLAGFRCGSAVLKRALLDAVAADVTSADRKFG